MSRSNYTKRYFVADEGGVYNAFSFDMFADGGYLEGHKGEAGYHINDYDILKCFSSWSAASDYADKMNDKR